MNRIILIGNGFDLAHGLNTRYQDFIKSVWKDIILDIKKLNEPRSSYSLSNDKKIFSFDYKQKINSAYFDNCSNLEINGNETYNDLCEAVDFYNDKCATTIKFEIKNTFLEFLLSIQGEKNWVDIEEEYYRQLKEKAKIKDEKERIDSIIKLNEELDEIKDLLDEYLQEELKNTEKHKQDNQFEKIIEEYKELFFDSFKKDDFTHDSIIRGYIQAILEELKNIEVTNKDELVDNIIDDTVILSQFYAEANYRALRMLNWKYILSSDLEDILKDPYYGKEFISALFVPKDILFLNFNYTHTTELYDKDFRTNHIHGELNQNGNSNPNHMIFGYGDELSDDYKELENLNENEVLENVKSIKYLEADNYRDLLSFIDSDKYQIYIFGHSCGISDRTLLNTLFEHENCISIKPFYFEWNNEDGDTRDNYREIVQNISRNFNNKVLMRSKVVNKTHCKPMPNYKV